MQNVCNLIEHLRCKYENVVVWITSDIKSVDLIYPDITPLLIEASGVRSFIHNLIEAKHKALTVYQQDFLKKLPKTLHLS